MSNTWSEWVMDRLVEKGMFENQATQVLEQVKSDPCNAAMSHRWNDSIDGYPPQMKTVIWMSVNSIALKWIDANCPRAWFRGIFAGGY